MAKHDHSGEQVKGWIVWDCRNGRVIPAIGLGDKPEDRVYTEAAARQGAEQLNRYVLRNTSPVLNKLAVHVEGPFYARPASKRRKLEGKTVGPLYPRA